jgi:hypothetical protein
MQRRTVNLRSATPISFVRDSDQERAYELEVRRARDVQLVRFAVAPRQQVTTHDGRTLTPGAEVRLSDFTYSRDAGPPWRQLERLVDRGSVIESYRWPTGPEAA